MLGHSSFHRCDRSLGAFDLEHRQTQLQAGSTMSDKREWGKANMGDLERPGRNATGSGQSCS